MAKKITFKPGVDVSKKNEKKYIISFIMILLGCITPTSCIIKAIEFNAQCKGYLKQAADANTVELAEERLDKAIEYIETHNLTEGYTSIIYKSEADNVGFWYKNIKACKKELSDSKNSTKLEKTNLLLKVRESLLDENIGNNGNFSSSVTVPRGISRYPRNTAYCLINILSFMVIFIGFVNILPKKVFSKSSLKDWM